MNIEVLISEEQLTRRIHDLAKIIDSDFNGEEVILLCVLKGSFIFTAELAKHMKNKVIIDFIQISSYEGTTSTGNIKMKLDISEKINGKNVVIIEDIIDTGQTIQYVMNYLQTFHPNTLKICSLLDKPSRREVEISADYIGFTIENVFVVGYGLDYNQYYRNLPFIGYIKDNSK